MSAADAMTALNGALFNRVYRKADCST